jgi:ABC-type dipeptide/oligopeptide/nickel transport system ATPase component
MLNPASVEPLLSVKDLKVHLRFGHHVVRAVDGVDFEVRPGECVGIVGESGSGKSTFARAVTRLMPNVDLAESSGDIRFAGSDLRTMPDRALRQLRRHAGFSMVFQDPLGYLNPTQRVGKQIAEALSDHTDSAPAAERVAALLLEVGLQNPDRIARHYPHELSGGMRQRVMIAIALACEPLLLFADEPTSALDVTIQQQVLKTLRRLHRDRKMAMVIITHDLGVVAALCDRVYVMHGGKVVESATTEQLFDHPQDAYTARLISLSARHPKAAGAATGAPS